MRRILLEAPGSTVKSAVRRSRSENVNVCSYLHRVKLGFDASHTFHSGDSSSIERADGHQACSDREVSLNEKYKEIQVLHPGELGDLEGQWDPPTPQAYHSAWGMENWMGGEGTGRGGDSWKNLESPLLT